MRLPFLAFAASTLVASALSAGCSNDNSGPGSSPEVDAGSETGQPEADAGGESNSPGEAGGPATSFLNCSKYGALSAAEACDVFAAAYCKAYNGCTFLYWSYPTDSECAAAQAQRCIQTLGSDGVKVRPAWFAALADHLENERCLSLAWDSGGGFLPALVTDSACGSVTGERAVGAPCSFGLQCSTGLCEGGLGRSALPGNSTGIYSQCGVCASLTGPAQKGEACEGSRDCAEGLVCVIVRYSQQAGKTWDECVDATRNRALGDECSSSVQCIGWPAEAVCVGYRSKTDTAEMTLGHCTKPAEEGEPCESRECAPWFWCDPVTDVCIKQMPYAAANEDCSLRTCDPMLPLECVGGKCVEIHLPSAGEACYGFDQCSKGLTCYGEICKELPALGGECSLTCAGSAWCLEGTCVELDSSSCK